MKENTGFQNPRRHAVSCNFGRSRAPHRFGIVLNSAWPIAYENLSVPQATEWQHIGNQIEAIIAVWFHKLHQNAGEE
jgi:hypothetical protein